MGLKLGEFGVRRFVEASAGGELVETDPFDATVHHQGTWLVTEEGLEIVTSTGTTWQLVTRQDTDGLYRGVEHSSEGHPTQRFVVAVHW